MTDPVDREWLYPPAQYELAVLDRLVRDGFAANRNVHYARNYSRVARGGEFRTAVVLAAPVTVRVWSTGVARAYLDTEPGSGQVLRPLAGADTPGGATLRLPAGTTRLCLQIMADEDEAVAISVRGLSDVTGWEARTLEDDARPTARWHRIAARRGPVPPHTGDLALRTSVRPELHDGIHSLPATVLGRPVVTAVRPPTIRSGESVAEALAIDEQLETRHDVVRRDDGRWTTRHLLGFRHLVVEGADDDDDEVEVEVSEHPAVAQGGFRCSDGRLQQIWDTSLRTLRACMHGLMLDGVKRDRMPWAGDQVLNSLSNSFAVGDRQIAWDSLEALGHPREGYVNGIADYSLWWVVNARLVARQLGGPVDPEQHARDVEVFVTGLLEHVDARGVFRPRRPDGPPQPGPGTVFIDWGVEVDPDRDPTALQMLWYWALRSAAEILERGGLDGRSWTERADRLREVLRAQAWDDESRRWTEYLGEGRTSGLHANLLAVLCGIGGGDPAWSIDPDAIDVARAGTPFMTTFALCALAGSGRQSDVVATVRNLWGAMLDRGATTFWEDFAGDGPDEAMYGRPFGRSLCHAWSSGPAYLLPSTILGIEVLEDGWARVRVAPALGDLGWAGATLPTPLGLLDVTVERDRAVLDIPAGMIVELGDAVLTGPAHVTIPHRELSPGRAKEVRTGA